MIDSTDIVSPRTQPNRRRAPAPSASRSTRTNGSAAKKRLNFERVFSNSKVNPFDQLEWERRTAEITDDSGNTLVQLSNGASTQDNTPTLSGLATEDDVQRCREAGFAEHLAKPVDLSVLLSKIDQIAAG